MNKKFYTAKPGDRTLYFLTKYNVIKTSQTKCFQIKLREYVFICFGSVRILVLFT